MQVLKLFSSWEIHKKVASDTEQFLGANNFLKYNFIVSVMMFMLLSYIEKNL